MKTLKKKTKDAACGHLLVDDVLDIVTMSMSKKMEGDTL